MRKNPPQFLISPYICQIPDGLNPSFLRGCCALIMSTHSHNRKVPAWFVIEAILFVLLSFFPKPAGAGTIRGSILDVGGLPLPDAVVYIEKVPGMRFPPSKEAILINQINLE